MFILSGNVGNRIPVYWFTEQFRCLKQNTNMTHYGKTYVNTKCTSKYVIHVQTYNFYLFFIFLYFVCFTFSLIFIAIIS